MTISARREPFLISTDPAIIDLDVVHDVLTSLYWCEGIPKETVRRGIEGSITFGVYDTSRPRSSARPEIRGHEPSAGYQGFPAQVGFARVITDKATFAYLSDVFIIDEYRSRGLSKWLIETILVHPDLQGLRRFCLLTRDAHGLYARYGFKPLPDAARYLEIWNPDVYRRPHEACDDSRQW